MEGPEKSGPFLLPKCVAAICPSSVNVQPVEYLSAGVADPIFSPPCFCERVGIQWIPDRLFALWAVGDNLTRHNISSAQASIMVPRCTQSVKLLYVMSRNLLTGGTSSCMLAGCGCARGTLGVIGYRPDAHPPP